MDLFIGHLQLEVLVTTLLFLHHFGYMATFQWTCLPVASLSHFSFDMIVKIIATHVFQFVYKHIPADATKIRAVFLGIFPTAEVTFKLTIGH